MAIRPASRRSAERLDELLARFELINAERSLLGLPRVDPLDGLDLSAPAVDAFNGPSFGSLAPSPPLRRQGAFSGGSGNDVLVGGAGSNTLSGGTGSDTLALLDRMIFDDDPVGFQGFKTQSQRQGLAARKGRREQRARDARQERRERLKRAQLDEVARPERRAVLTQRAQDMRALNEQRTQRMIQVQRLLQAIRDGARRASQQRKRSRRATLGQRGQDIRALNEQRAQQLSQFDQRMRELGLDPPGTVASRVTDAAKRGALKEFRRGGPLGLSPEQVRDLRARGFFTNPNSPLALGPFQTFNEGLIGGGAALLDVVRRLPSTATAAVGEGIGQGLGEFGLDPNNNAARDIRGMLDFLLQEFALGDIRLR